MHEFNRIYLSSLNSQQYSQRVAMEEQTIVIRIRNGDPLLVPKQRLTADSSMFRYLLDELKYDELNIDDFSPEAVSLFLTLLEDKQLGEIEHAMFRELHKLAVVFEVDWLKESCRGWLRRKMDSATEDEEKTFLFEECWYILKKWEEKGIMDALVSSLAPKDNSSFISNYMSDFDKLETGQIDLVLKLGGSNTDLFLRTILQNLTGQRELNENVKHLLQKMNLALCSERNEELYLELFDTISNLSEISMTDMRFAFKMTSDTARLVSSRKEKMRTKTSVFHDENKYLFLVNSCKTLNDITKAVTEDRVISIFVAVEILLAVFLKNTPNREDTQIFVTTLENICSDKKLQKVSRQYLDIIIAALNYSNLEQSYQIITLLNEIKINEKLCTYHENVIIRCIKRYEFLTVRRDKKYKDLFTFKHPRTRTCTESGSRCGFILRLSERDGNWTLELCTNSEDYTDTGIHFHDTISAHEMFLYTMYSGNTAAGNKVTVAGGWMWWKIPHRTDWKFEARHIARHIAYNVTDHLVARQE